MNLNIVGNELYLYDPCIKKKSWCAVHLTDMVDGIYYIKEEEGRFSFICKRYRKVRKDWQITEDEFGLDSDAIKIESGGQKTEIDLSEYNVPKNTVLSVEVCRNKDGMIFGIRWVI